MTNPTFVSTGSFDELIATRLLAEAAVLAARWLERLTALLPQETQDVFPGDRLLDHIPAVVTEIAKYIGAPEADEIAANTAVIEKARELGLLRHEQRASLHQLLREYELLADILAAFLAEETSQTGTSAAILDGLRVARRIDRAVRALMRVTVETFVAKYTETLNEQERKLEKFRYMASHELRNPIGTLMFATRLLRNAERTDPQHWVKVLDTMDRNLERVTTLLNNLQRLSGDTLAGDGPTEQVTEVAALAKDVARQLRHAADARGVAISVSERLPVVVTDPARIDLILTNLLSNAIKYSDPDKPVRHVDIDALDTEPGWWGLIVRDNGLGIPQDDVSAIFDRFTRAHAHRDAELGIDGSGLGLTIAKESVIALGGAIACQSVLGEGTVFELRVPIRRDVSSR
jgi:signal transduction histidine kinase